MRSDQRQEIVDIAHELHHRGWVANHDGNVSARISDKRFLTTPTATSKAKINQSMLLEVDKNGKRLSGTHQPFGELKLHLAIYQARPDVHAVVHAHPPNATAIASTGQNIIAKPFIAEAVVSLGPHIPCLPETSTTSLANASKTVDAVMLQNHGVFTWGSSLELALLRMELVEHLANIALKALPLGGHKSLSPDEIKALLDKRSKAGLGMAADNALSLANALAPSKILACAPAPHTSLETRSLTPSLADIIREEVNKVIR